MWPAARSKRRLVLEALECRRLLAADLIVEVDAPHELTPGEGVSYSVRFTNDGSDDAVGVDLFSDPTGFLEEVSWQRQTSNPARIRDVSPGGTGSLRITGAMTEGREMISQGDWGDFNGDGFDDLFFAVSRVNKHVEGADALAYVIFGAEDGLTGILDVGELDGTNGFVLADVDGGIINSVASGGDVNGDGIDDLLVGAASGRAFDLNMNRGTTDLGVTYLVYGSEERSAASISLESIDGASGLVIEGSLEDSQDEYSELGSYSGFDVSGAGDINGDGFDDVVVTSLGTGDMSIIAGRSYVVFGGADLPESIVLGDLNGNDGFRADFPQTGRSVAAGGDFNGDGIDDLLVAGHTPFEFTDTPPGYRSYSQAFVVFGTRDPFGPVVNTDELDGSAGFVVEGGPVFIYHYSPPAFPFVSSAGDVNGDGLDDFVLGSPTTIASGQVGSGAAHVVFGSDDGFPPILDVSALDGQNGVFLSSFHRNTLTGVRGDAVGDFNGDGLDDLVVETDFFWQRDEVRDGAYLVLGSRDGYETPIDLYEIDGRKGTLFEGLSFANGGGDFNGDGLADILGRQGADVSVVFGRRTPNIDQANGVGAFRETLDLAAYTMVSYEVTGVVKASAMGSENFTAGSMLAADRVESVSVGTVVREVDLAIDAVGPEVAFPGQRIAQEVTIEHRGFADAGLVEIDSSFDGIEDLAWTRTVTRPVKTFEPLTVLDAGEEPGNVAAIDLGEARAVPAGDVDGDGLTDLLIGLPNTTGEGDERGIVHVVYGTPDGYSIDVSTAHLDGVAGFTVAVNLAGDRRFLADLAAGGDINGDGFHDVLVSGMWEERSYVIFGSERRLRHGALDVAALDGTNGFALARSRPVAIGDINLDGYDDIASGREVLFGAPQFDAQTTINRNNGVFVEFASGITLVGDVNEDGFDDMVLVEHDLWPRIGILTGSADGFGDISEVDLQDNPDLISLGSLEGRVSAVPGGDFNGDGVQDVVVAYNGDVPQDVTHSGFVIYFGSSDSSDGFDSLQRERWRSWLGIDSVSVGDINHDGLDDVIAAPGVIFGSRQFADPFSWRTSLDSLDRENGFRFMLPPGQGNIDSVDSLGDLNGDTLDDYLIVGVRPEGSAGRWQFERTAYVWFAPSETEIETGAGKIDHELSIGIGTRVRYGITGRLPVDVSDVVDMSFSVSANDLRTELDPSDNMAAHTIAIQPSVAGDLNLDGVVDFGDYLVLSANFGRNNVSASEGDLDVSGVIDFSDFVLLRDVFGRRF